MRLWCVDHEEDVDEPSVEAQIIYHGDSLCLEHFYSRTGTVEGGPEA